MRIVSRVPGLYAAVAFLLARRVTIEGWSMAPALLPGDRILFDRLAYVRSHPRRGDIVIAAHPLRPSLRLAKRITAVPGDTISDGQTLAKGEYWLEGDNLDASTDSRGFGLVTRRDLLGRAWLIYSPAERWQIIN